MVRPILWCSPIPPVRSGVSAYATELLTELARRVPIRAVRPPSVEPDAIDPHFPVELAPPGQRPEDDEIAVVHLGNNPHHLWVLPYLRESGVVAVLHDLVLHHLVVEDRLGEGDWRGYAALVDEAHPGAGQVLGDARSVGRSGRLDAFLFPALRPFLRNARAVVTHSDWAAERVRAAGLRCAVFRCPLHVADPGPLDRAALRSEVGAAEDEVVLMHLGFLTREKGMRPVLEALATWNTNGGRARLVLVGEGDEASVLTRAAESLGVAEALSLTGWVSEERMRRLPAAADLGVALRDPSAGESSAAALRFLAAGTPVAVIARRQYLEIPEACAPRITPGAAAAADLVRLLDAAAEPTWQRRRQSARAHYESGHRPEQAADAWVALLERLSDR